MSSNLKLLQETSAFRSLAQDQLATLTGLLKYRQFAADVVIWKAGALGDTMYIIDKGQVVFFTGDAAGNQKVFRTVGAGAFFGEVALLNDGIRSAHAKTVGEVFAWECTGINSTRFCKFIPRWP